MTNFDYQTPTRLIFGRGVVAEKLQEVMKQFGPRVLLTYGGGSIKRSGLYDQVKELLQDKQIFELPGIKPNPKFNPSVLEGTRICKAERIDVILSVGGGSVLDCSKAIAGCALSDADPWDVVTLKVPTTKALPIVDIITMAATGSEYDSGAVISRTETNDKVCYMTPYTFPAVSFIDPTYTFTLSPKQTRAGVSDCINHIMESYFVADHIAMNDAFMEGAVRSLVKNVKVVLAEPDNYEARAEIFYATTLGCNGIYCLGNSYGFWPMHMMEHSWSGFYDITHGEGLAIIAPRWLKYILAHTEGELHEQVVERITSFGRGVFGTTTPEAAIQALYDFFKEIGMPMELPAAGIPDDSRVDEMAEHVDTKEHLDLAWVPLHKPDIAAIMRDCFVAM